MAEHVVALTIEPPGPDDALDRLGVVIGISVSSVQRIRRAHGLQLHRLRQFKLSNDPQFAARLRDIVRLYVHPPAHAIVLSVDEKSQIQALDRTHPLLPFHSLLDRNIGQLRPGLPLKRGQCGTMTHDDKQNGATTLCRPERARRQGHRPLHAAASPSGVHPFPQCHRARGSGRQADPRDLDNYAAMRLGPNEFCSVR